MIRRTLGILLLGASLVSADVTSVRRGFDPLRTGLIHALGGKGKVYYCCAFSSDGKYFAAGTLQGPIHLFNARTWDKISEFGGHNGGVWAISFSPDGRRLATGGQDGQVTLWDTAGQREIRDLGRHQAMIWGLSFSPDGTHVASSAMDGTTKIFTADKGEEKVTIQGTHPNSRPVLFSPDGSRLVLSAMDGSLKTYLTKDGSEEKSIDTGGDPIVVAAMSRDGRTVFGATQNGALNVYDLSLGKQSSQISNAMRGQQIMSMVLSPDGKYLIVGEVNVVKIFDVKTLKRIAVLRGHRSSIYAVAMSPDGRTLSSASAEGALNIWGYKPGAANMMPKARGYLGVTVQNPAGGAGCEIQQVMAGTAAEKAGLQGGDLILKVGKTEINSYEEAVQAIGSHKEGDEVEFTIQRDGKEQKIKIKLGPHPDENPPQEEDR